MTPCSPSSSPLTLSCSRFLPGWWLEPPCNRGSCPPSLTVLFLPPHPAFKLLESSSQKFLQGLVYLIGNLLGLALAVYKCQSMGLLPTHASDWLAFIEPPEVRGKARVGGGLSSWGQHRGFWAEGGACRKMGWGLEGLC